jgi:hypothetical protein
VRLYLILAGMIGAVLSFVSELMNILNAFSRWSVVAMHVNIWSCLSSMLSHRLQYGSCVMHHFYIRHLEHKSFFKASVDMNKACSDTFSFST